MADEMTRQEFAEYMAAFEQRLETRFDGLDTRLDRHDRRFDSLDARLVAHDRRFDGLDARLTAHDRRFDGLDARLTAHDRRFDGLDLRLQEHDRGFDGLGAQLQEHDRGLDRLEGGLSDLKQSMTIQFEETRREFKLSLEAVAALDETTRTGFSEIRRDHAEHKADLERAIRHVRIRAEHLEEHVERRNAE